MYEPFAILESTRQTVFLNLLSTYIDREICVLLLQPSCRIESRSSEKGYAPLHVAVSEGHTALVELLVGYGANVNTAVEDGSTPLLMVLTQKKMKPLSSDTPHLQQVSLSEGVCIHLLIIYSTYN